MTYYDPRTERTLGVAEFGEDDLLGEIISWEAPHEISLTDLRDALTGAGYDPALARDMLPRNAWARAARRLEEGRVIKLVEDAGGVMLFQFTKEYLDQNVKQYHYNVETMLELDKAAGKVSCGDVGLEQTAQQLIDEQMGKRAAHDVTRIVQKVLRQHGDLFPIRRQGGVYFVPTRHAFQIEKLSRLMTEIKGNVIRFPVPAGNPQARQTAAQVMQEELHRRIEEHLDAISEYGPKVPEDALEARTLGLLKMQGELEAYRDVLEYHHEKLEEHLQAAKDALTQKMLPSEE